MKKLLPVLLLILFTLSSLAFYPFFKIRQYQARKEVKARIKQSVPEKELHTVVFKKNETIHWIREGKEFRLGIHLYDIVKTEYQNGLVIYLCIDDTQEARLFTGLEEQVDRELNTDKKNRDESPGKLINLFSQVCPPGSGHFTLYSISIPEATTSIPSLRSFPNEVITPPPDLRAPLKTWISRRTKNSNRS